MYCVVFGFSKHIAIKKAPLNNKPDKQWQMIVKIGSVIFSTDAQSGYISKTFFNLFFFVLFLQDSTSF